MRFWPASILRANDDIRGYFNKKEGRGKEGRKERKKGPPRKTKQSCSERELPHPGDPGQAVTAADTSVPKLFIHPNTRTHGLARPSAEADQK